MKRKYWFGLLTPISIGVGIIISMTILINCSKDKNPIKPSMVNTVTDIDGNVYQTVKIGDQWWMAVNLKVTHYRNGDEIPNVTNDMEWNNLVTGAYCNYNNDFNNAVVYGRLYNWYAVNDSRNIAPAGWHVSTFEEWGTLADYLGGLSVAGGKMKESGYSHWQSPNTGATNESGFTALPGGARVGYTGLGYYGCFWTFGDSDVGHYKSIAYDKSEYNSMNTLKIYGFSIRCIRD